MTNRSPLPITEVTTRSSLIDALKAGASQLILLHHVATYGPISDELYPLAPGILGLLYDYGRWAVQIFLVVAGYLTARSLLPASKTVETTLFQPIAKRYLRLIPPYLVALSIAMVCNAVAHPWLPEMELPTPPTWSQWFAHVILAQDFLGFSALSAGAWYISIDFQLFVMMLVLVWLGKRAGKSVPWLLISALGLASLFGFNRYQSLDHSGLYFFAAYSLGAAAHAIGSAKRPLPWLLAVGAIVGLSLAIDFRGRLLLAAGTALVLLYKDRFHLLNSKFLSRPIATLGRISYALFLVHYPIYLLGNVVFVRFDAHGPAAAMGFALTVWICIMLAAGVFYRWVEFPCTQYGSRSKSTNPTGRM